MQQPTQHSSANGSAFASLRRSVLPALHSTLQLLSFPANRVHSDQVLHNAMLALLKQQGSSSLFFNSLRCRSALLTDIADRIHPPIKTSRKVLIE
jgi:hypothetical protein